jgi:hypothetical protein
LWLWLWLIYTDACGGEVADVFVVDAEVERESAARESAAPDVGVVPSLSCN